MFIKGVALRQGASIRTATVGDAPVDRTPSGLWPSDHAGVVAHLPVDSDLTAATLTRADMRKVDLSGKGEGLPPVLIRAVLIGADLSDANLNGADLRGADLSYTTMARTYLGSAILNGATMVDVQGCDDSGRLPGCYLD